MFQNLQFKTLILKNGTEEIRFVVTDEILDSFNKQFCELPYKDVNAIKGQSITIIGAEAHYQMDEIPQVMKTAVDTLRRLQQEYFIQLVNSDLLKVKNARLQHADVHYHRQKSVYEKIIDSKSKEIDELILEKTKSKGDNLNERLISLKIIDKKEALESLKNKYEPFFDELMAISKLSTVVALEKKNRLYGITEQAREVAPYLKTINDCVLIAFLYDEEKKVNSQNANVQQAKPTVVDFVGQVAANHYEKVKATVAHHRDPMWTVHLRNLGKVLATIFFGGWAVFAIKEYNYRKYGSDTFWTKPSSEKIVDGVQKDADAFLKAAKAGEIKFSK